jgi:hypothetical protein
MRTRVLPLLLLFAASGCALFTRSVPLEIRRFSPELPRPEPLPRPQTAPLASLSLGRISAGSELGRRIVRRTSPVELEPYEDLWWTEPPDAYVRRAVERALFEERPLREAKSEPAPRLDVEVLAFEQSGDDLGRVQLRWELSTREAVIARGEVTREGRAHGPDFSAVAVAIGEAMNAAVSEVADRVQNALVNPPRASSEPAPRRSDADPERQRVEEE